MLSVLLQPSAGSVSKFDIQVKKRREELSLAIRLGFGGLQADELETLRHLVYHLIIRQL